MTGSVVRSPAYGLHANTGTLFSAAAAQSPGTVGLVGSRVGDAAAKGANYTPRINVTPSWLQAVLGDVWESFGALTWWERVHVTPYYSDLGFHLSTQQITVYVWNASRVAARTSYEYEITGEDGVTLDSPPTFPLHFPAGLEFAFTVEVDEDGAPNFENAVIFRFAGFEDTETDAVFEGIRVVPWPIDPSGFVTETYGYLTRIIASMADAEQRAALREIPVRSWTFDFSLIGRDARIAQTLLYAWSARPYGLPIWYEETELDAPVSAGGVVLPADVNLRDWGELALLWLNSYTYEAVLIDDVTSTGLELGSVLLNDWPAGTKLYPVRLARVDPQSTISYASLESGTYRITFRGEDWSRTA